MSGLRKLMVQVEALQRKLALMEAAGEPARTRPSTTASASCQPLTDALIAEAMGAYADAVAAHASDGNVPEEAFRKRNLDWKSAALLSPRDYGRLTKRAIPGGYNKYSAGRVARILAKRPVCARLAREGSVATYVEGPADALASILRSKHTLKADEAGIEDGILRLWWD